MTSDEERMLASGLHCFVTRNPLRVTILLGTYVASITSLALTQRSWES